MFTISLFDAPSRTDEVVNQIIVGEPALAIGLQKQIDLRTNNPSAPTYFSFATWRRYHELGCYQGSSAIVLEYSKRSDAEWELIADAITATGYKALVFDTVKGVAFAFPITNCTKPGTYTRALQVLAELIGQKGLVSEPGATYLVRPKKGAQVVEMGSDVINADQFIPEFSAIPNNTLADWMEPFTSSQPGRNVSPPKPAIAKAQIPSTALANAKITVTPKSVLDQFFDEVDDSLTGVATQFEAIGKTFLSLAEKARKQGGAA
jgi:hypothetical protein